MNKASTVIVAAIAALGVIGITTAIITSAAPAHAKINSCGVFCSSGGSGQQGGGGGGHETRSGNVITDSGGNSVFGGGRVTSDASNGKVLGCVGSICK